MDIYEKAFYSAHHIQRSMDPISNGKTLIFTNAAFRATDGEASYGFVMLRNDIPFVEELIMGRVSLPLKKQRHELSSW